MKSYKHRLELNNKQFTLAKKHAGTARHAYNWGLDLCLQRIDADEKLPSAIDLHKLLVKDVKSVNQWYYEVSKCAPQEALRNLHKGWGNFFRKIKSGELEKCKNSYIKNRKSRGLKVDNKKLFNLCKPKFKCKGVKESFYLEGKILVNGNKIKLPRFGWVAMSESYDVGFEVKNVTISRHANHFFVSFKTEAPTTSIKDIEKQSAIGVDVGIKTLATLSDGRVFENPRAFNRYKRKLRIAQRIVSKRFNKNIKKQSKNYEKAKKRVAKLHYKISCIRKDNIHKLTTYLAKNHSIIGIEDLNIKGMLKNRRLSNAIQDGGFYEFRRQLEYKCDWYGSKLVVIDRFYPSSKTCSCCGHKKEKLSLSTRTYECDNCGLVIDRDLNGAINIEDLAVSYTVSACGELHPPNINGLETLRSRNKTVKR